MNHSQRAIEHSTLTLKAVANNLETTADPNAQAVAQIAERLGQMEACLAETCKEFYVWEVLLGVDQGVERWMLTVAVLLYNLLRGVLTWKVGPLRDEEERTDTTPALDSYLWLFYLHRVATVLLVVAVVAFAYSTAQWLSLTVSLPA
ncbi:MAG: hypothetical protein AAGC60_00210 [Acidobacteriota bacterium]